VLPEWQILAALLLHGVAVHHGKHTPAITAGRACPAGRLFSSAAARRGRNQSHYLADTHLLSVLAKKKQLK